MKNTETTRTEVLLMNHVKKAKELLVNKNNTPMEKLLDRCCIVGVFPRTDRPFITVIRNEYNEVKGKISLNEWYNLILEYENSDF